ncbi:hypothetical protein ACINWC743_A0566 [Acinetobacter sp. WC-743]|nr:hypothetical protein ACINWC743_A0566 [Acinetobacter sp. WC-743]
MILKTIFDHFMWLQNFNKQLSSKKIQNIFFYVSFTVFFYLK